MDLLILGGNSQSNQAWIQDVAEELKDVFGLAVTMVTTAKTKEEALDFFELLGIPFKK